MRKVQTQEQSIPATAFKFAANGTHLIHYVVEKMFSFRVRLRRRTNCLELIFHFQDNPFVRPRKNANKTKMGMRSSGATELPWRCETRSLSACFSFIKLNACGIREHLLFVEFSIRHEKQQRHFRSKINCHFCVSSSRGIIISYPLQRHILVVYETHFNLLSRRRRQSFSAELKMNKSGTEMDEKRQMMNPIFYC